MAVRQTIASANNRAARLRRHRLLVGRDLEALEGRGAKGCSESDVGGVAAARRGRHRPGRAPRSHFSPDTPSDRCAHCGGLEASNAVLKPIGWGVRRAWLHDGCWAPWREARRIADRENGDDGDREPMTGVKLKLEDRWKHRPTAPAPVASPLPRVDEARAGMEKARIARWVTAQIVNYPPDRCLGCRRPIVFGARWVELVNDNTRARLHFDGAPCGERSRKSPPVWRLGSTGAVANELLINSALIRSLGHSQAGPSGTLCANPRDGQEKQCSTRLWGRVFSGLSQWTALPSGALHCQPSPRSC